MTGLPRGWELRQLGEVAQLVRGVTYNKAQAREQPEPGLLPLLRATNIKGDLALNDAMVYVPASCVSPTQMLQLHDIVLAASSGSISFVGKSAMLTRPWVGAFGAFCSVLRPSPAIDASFLGHYVSSRAVRHRWSEAARGTNINNLKRGDILDTPVALPPLIEQRRIVEILEDHLSRLQAAERYLGSVLSKGDLAEGAVLQSVLQGGVRSDAGDISSLAAERQRRCPPDMKRGRPKAASVAAVDVPWAGRWPTVSLEQATDPVRTISYGILKPGPNLEIGTPYVRVVNMRRDVLALDDLHRTSAGIAGQYARASLEPEDVLVSIRGTYGRVVLVPKELQGGNITQDTARLAVLPQLLPAFVALVLRSPWAQAHLKRIARGVAVKGVNITDLRQLPVPLPSLALQGRLVDHAEELTSDLQEATRSARVGLRRASALRRALLEAAFSGRLTRTVDVLEGSDV